MSKQDKDNDNDTKWMLKSFYRYSTIGLEVAFAIIIGFFLGKWLDSKFDTQPYLTISGFFLGIAAAVKSIFRLIKLIKTEKF